MVRAGVFLVTGLVLVSGTPPIRYESRVVDPHFAARHQLCPGAPDSGGLGLTNDSHRTVAEFIGPDLREITVHQIGDSFPRFAPVQRHIREVLAKRPQMFSRYSPWAEGTPLAGNGILATLRYSGRRTGQLEIAGSHLCWQDTSGTVWWARVAPVDVWNRP
jgi:hypothetical protein